MKFTTKNTKKKFHLLITLMLIAIFITAIIVEKATTKLSSTVTSISTSLEQTERSRVSDSLIRFSTSVEREFYASGNKSTRIPTEMFRDNLNIIEKNYVTGIKIINIGYNASEYDTTEDIEKIAKEFPAEYAPKITKNIEDMLRALRSNDENISTAVNDAVDNICNNTNLNKEKMYSAITSNILVTNSIVMDTNSPEEDAHVISNEELQNLLQSKNNVWSEWITIPDGHLGINDLAAKENGKPNIDYSKYYVIATLDSNAILSTISNVTHNIDFISMALMISFVFISLAALILCIISFYKKINGGVDIEPIVSGSTIDDDDDFYKLLCRIQRHIEQIRNGQNTKNS